MELNSKYVNGGKKLKSFVDRIVVKSKKKDVNIPLIEEITKYLSIEKAKIEEQKNKIKLISASNTPKKSNLKNSKIQELNVIHQRDKIDIGSTVKLLETKQTGRVEEINGTTITVVFGFIKMKVDINKLMWVG